MTQRCLKTNHSCISSKSFFKLKIVLLTGLLISVFFSATNFAGDINGYYRYPALHGNTIVFVAEGDLWKVPVSGGMAQRLTTHPGEETNPHISPDGATIAFTATYEGPSEVYTMPITGGIPQRCTFENESSIATTWSPSGNIIYTTSHYSTLPNAQLVSYNLQTKQRTRIPLSQASEGTYNDSGNTLFFVRPAYHRNVTKRYKGGTARKIWKFTKGQTEAIQLSDKYEGESHHPMWWNGRIYFITDRDGIMNIWSMTDEGKDLKQHTHQANFDIRYASLNQGRIVYHTGADIWLFNIQTGEDKLIPITLASDLDQLREKWVENPSQYITSVHLHPKGDQIVITSRGRVFVAPVQSGRFVQLSRKEGVRYRDAIFMPKGEDILTLSDESGEFEFVKMPATGIGNQEPLTHDGKILRFTGIPSPDGKYIAYRDLNNDLWLFAIKTKIQKRISTNREGIGDMVWSPDSKWIAFSQAAENSFLQIYLYNLEERNHIALTSNRANSGRPSWSPDGKWIYFLSDRNFRSLVSSPWGSRQPEPYLDRQEKIYQISLLKEGIPPFKPYNELYKKGKKDKKEAMVRVDIPGLQERIWEVPVKPGNYSGLSVTGKALYYISRGTGVGAKRNLMVLKIDNQKPEAKVMTEGVRSFELSGNRKKLLIHKGSDFYVVDAGTSPLTKLKDAKVNLSNWKFSLDPREDWKQLFTDAWRMERDYFYDPNMHGVDWDGMYKKYLPLVDRVTTRNELSDLIGRYVGELSVLHTSVRGGDMRTGNDKISVAGLGARFSRDEQKGGYRIDYIYQTDPDYPNERGPLSDPNLGISVGDVITHINGDATLSQNELGALLRNQSGKLVRLTVVSATTGDKNDVLIKPVSSESGLRYSDWEYSRRQIVEKEGDGKVGYVHLRAMGGNDISQWFRDFYPIYNRPGMIIDVRHNNGGNIDSFILERLLRKAWFFFQSRVGNPTWNMQYAFRGHIVVLVDENTASDGEAFAEGFKRLELGKVIGKRTWGGEVWLGSQNRLSDGGLARTPMMGVYGPDGIWLVEGHGVDPDIEIDNLPHATFNGQDAQLDAAIHYMLELLKTDPRKVPVHPPYPDKSFKNN